MAKQKPKQQTGVPMPPPAEQPEIGTITADEPTARAAPEPKPAPEPASEPTDPVAAWKSAVTARATDKKEHPLKAALALRRERPDLFEAYMAAIRSAAPASDSPIAGQTDPAAVAEWNTAVQRKATAEKMHPIKAAVALQRERPELYARVKGPSGA